MTARRRRTTGPRGELDRAGFQALVVAAAETIVRAEGVRGLGIRPLAAAIGYAPNSIYNAVGDLDQVVLRVNARTLTRLHAALSAALDRQATPLDNALALAEAYLAFVASDPMVWGLVHEYAPAPGTAVPAEHGEALAAATGLVGRALAPLLPEAGERTRVVAALWAALHGLAALSTSGKLAALTPEAPGDLARLLVRRVLGADRAVGSRPEPG